jgi:GLPGLI family protein
MVDWLINEHDKKIEDKKIFKAEAKKIDNYKFVNKDLVFFFDPTINLNSGPFVFGNLPGLILKLENINLTFELVSISKTNLEIPSLEKFVKNKPVITFKEARAFHKKVSNSILKN